MVENEELPESLEIGDHSINYGTFYYGMLYNRLKNELKICVDRIGQVSKIYYVEKVNLRTTFII